MFTSASELHDNPTKFAMKKSFYVHIVPNKRGNDVLNILMVNYGIVC